MAAEEMAWPVALHGAVVGRGQGETGGVDGVRGGRRGGYVGHLMRNLEVGEEGEKVGGRERVRIC